ncbi:hypothetical protein BDQ17DRAFT_413407 [Cyathus striatus]|nr:hypothetical protein BDQ17DRAFT_413407 [Cyathus striatus]
MFRLFLDNLLDGYKLQLLLTNFSFRQHLFSLLMKTTPYERTLNYHVGPNEFEKVQATPEKQKPSIKNIVDYTKQLKPSLSDSWNTANLQKGKVTNEIDVRQPKSTIKSTKKHEKLVFGLDRQLHENIKDEKNVYKICQDLKNRMQSLEDDYENVFKKRKEFSESSVAAFAESQKTEIEKLNWRILP